MGGYAFGGRFNVAGFEAKIRALISDDGETFYSEAEIVPFEMSIGQTVVLQLFSSEVESKKEIHLAKGPKFLIDIVAPIDLSSALRAKALIQIDGYMNIPVMKFSAEAHVSLNSDGFRLATVVNYFGVTEVAVTIGFGFDVSSPDLYFQFTKPLEVQLGDITMIGMYKSQTDQTSGPFVEIKGLSAEASTYVSIPLLHVSVGGALKITKESVKVTLNANFFGAANLALSLGWKWDFTNPDVKLQFDEPLNVVIGGANVLSITKSKTKTTEGPLMSFDAKKATASGYVNIPMLGFGTEGTITMTKTDVEMKATTTFFGLAGTIFTLKWKWDPRTPSVSYTAQYTVDLVDVADKITEKINDQIDQAYGGLC